MYYDDVSLMTITLVLFLIMDPIGNIPAFLSMVAGIDPKRQRWIIVRELCIALLAMFAFNFLGEYIFTYLEISVASVRIASGVILFLIAIKILFPSDNGLRTNLPKGEPFIVPLAIPLIAGPSLLATIMLYAKTTVCYDMMLAAIIIATLASGIILLASPWLKRLIGDNGLMACERLMGMVLVMLAIQRFFEGIQQFIKELPS
jgi:multiple antibiotic resistance protein